ncbi:MAG: tetratricopeptide repeat protein [Candidatus Poribacteria bacterium]|nr:tetratricopeptide repeat protein [Candidatus Poribacteria bacterium]MDP6750162.1 tetratricopeptide repeat protein [Candidatus Poribacteria bacterium]MDP6961922.1 tetratricopeptide repeat protein [Dehalococcoidia bacterium]
MNTQILPPSSQPDLEAQAITLHRSDQLTAAGNICRSLIESDPANFRAFHLLGVMAIEIEEYEQAVELLMQALEIFPLYAEAYGNLGIALEKLDLIEDAIFCFQKAVEIDLSQISGYHNLATLYRQHGLLDEAIATLESALESEPQHRTEDTSDENLSMAKIHFSLGLIRKEQNQTDQAITAFETALSIDPNLLGVHFELAEILFNQLKTKYPQQFHAAALINRPLTSTPDETTTEYLENLNRIIGIYQSGLKVEPDNFKACHNLGFTQMMAHQLDEAEMTLQTALRLNPEHAPSYSKLGDMFDEKGDTEQAIQHYRRGLLIQPNDFITRANLGVALIHQGEIDGAITELRSAISLNPTSAEAHFNLSSLLLLSGNYKEGWPEYEWRLELDSSTLMRNQQFTKPRWNGEQLDGQKVLIYNEQGFGDGIQFVRFLNLVEDRGGRVILETDPTLLDLFQQLNRLPVVETVTQKKTPPTDLDTLDYDCYTSLISLPHLFGLELEDIPAPMSYLEVPTDKTVEGVTGSECRIGLVWAGSRAHGNDKNRSIDLQQFKPLLSRNDCRFYSLQVGRESDQQRQIFEQYQVVDLSPQLTDFALTAAAIQQLDLVITVDTSVAHLAGALGKAVWIVLPYVPDWRWLLDRDDSPWYPSMRLFRQTQAGDWPGVFSRVSEALDSL